MKSRIIPVEEHKTLSRELSSIHESLLLIHRSIYRPSKKLIEGNLRIERTYDMLFDQLTNLSLKQHHYSPYYRPGIATAGATIESLVERLDLLGERRDWSTKGIYQRYIKYRSAVITYASSVQDYAS
jgi:hypothetical protein